MTAPSSAPDTAVVGPIALVRRPSPRVADGLTTHIERQAVDAELAAEQWAGYVAAMRGTGWRTVEVDAADECPDGVFVEDTVVVMGRTAVLTRPGAPSRRAEVAGTGDALRELGFDVRELGAGTLDGGDVMQVGDRVYVGRGGRTDAAGVAALRSAAALLGRTVVAVPLTRVLHLKSAVTALPDGTIIGYPPIVDDPGFFPLFRPMPEEGGAHVVDLGEGRLLIAASAPRSADLLADLGFTPVPVEIGEFEKLEGCVTCLSVRLRTPR
ncbi:N(G),N(G)-dimethylarginine dimethylaminohydrolase [Nakamurella flavida]|uniref:N(G),N(G)-dimethylarginine dimethylaminohydrolase n=1 Tax=Nakamurella flavida TaxID=363630 RepID=A0A938YL48_9ACTN|nr:dimethylargininase [Nakamurella flavida]MBM9477174.1 N(G),N(G)-dimethylarginine dimethylaminohydrolase [Nakamurella flavida]MDP9780123.1 dimethylargininase [Nakamurella flavida]